ncbi:hypothetical protein ES319_A10G095600v1 [Gossypium barbadense]|uniref:Uncharacterized protein n=1 Tax=Gossypium barbadense TaxID=3634 RepID=A0A5J5U0S0_GOSBA|nr:hypothetical protein ES319_A10G095600v1 [Gossypium barbadense]
MAMMTCSRIFLCYSTPRSQFPTVISSPSHFLTPKKATYKSTKHITLNANGGNSRFMARVSSSSAAEFPTNIGDMLSEVTIFTASGQPVLFKDLWDQTEVPFPMDSLYADPERKAYDVLGLYYGLGRTFFNPASAKVFSRLDKVKKAMENYTIKATPDDTSSVLQQGGMFVFKGKQLLYTRKDEGTGDHAPLDDIFDVCCKTPVA